MAWAVALGELLAKARFLRGELAPAAAEEGEEWKQVEQERIIEPRFLPDQSR